MMVETDAAVDLASGVWAADAPDTAVDALGIPNLPGVPCAPLVPGAGPAADDNRLSNSVTKPKNEGT